MCIIRYVHYSTLVRSAAKLRSATSLSFPKKYLFIYFLLFFFTLQWSRRGRVAVFKIKTVITVHSWCFSSELTHEKRRASEHHVRFTPFMSGHMETKRQQAAHFRQAAMCRKLRLFPISRTQRLVLSHLYPPPHPVT